MSMSPEAGEVLAVLQQHVSPINARSMLRHVLRSADLDETTMERRHLLRVVQGLERSTMLFVGESGKKALAAALWALVPAQTETPPIVFRLESEDDVNRARVGARVLCADVGAPSLQAQKIATAVSELARNVVKYAKVGSIELAVRVGPPPFFAIRAIDEGPGIANLDHVLGGSYKSKTGMGLGLLGTRRLADRFDVATSPKGTTVVVEVRL